MSRDDRNTVLHGVMLKEPSVGDLFQIYFDDGKFLRTSTVRRVVRRGDELLVETLNSTYRLRPDPASSN